MEPRDTEVGKGGGWVVAQIALMVACAGLGWVWSGQWSGRWNWVPALILTLVGAGFGIAGVWVLGRNRTIYPQPRPGSVLVQHGIYRHVRHPLYASVMLLAIAWGIWCRSVPALVGSLGLVVFLVLKARSEEVRLQRQFPGYATYCDSRKWRFLPWVF